MYVAGHTYELEQLFIICLIIRYADSSNWLISRCAFCLDFFMDFDDIVTVIHESTHFIFNEERLQGLLEGIFI